MTPARSAGPSQRITEIYDIYTGDSEKVVESPSTRRHTAHATLRWEARSTLLAKGDYTLMVRCTNSDGAVQPVQANWNPPGFMRNVIEATPIVAA